ncbi:lysis system i-spanin subunit Rz [Paraburkholderia sp. SARCC-3016]|uniref:lysis system i-spanin subunit Rz n=1 Tax=Paraburkholderia sp. SARCC-3016 TaxID=3058611 RepID=UPI002807B86C|nr:lysis system i-spanin subunit Rz [Paraburkholderia sp. SARCC-3016]MDQ7982241.1 lysis system i-spanin subunit Rz [Paraburkholderia sp. SARCC-3016]
MSPYLLTGLAAGLLGIAIGAGGGYELTANHYRAELSTEQAAHARDNEQHANDLNLISKAALDAENRAIDAHTVAEGKIATLDDQLTKEKQAHEADNARNRAAIADGSRRLRIAVSNFHPASSEQAGTGTGAGSMGDGASGTADLAPAFGVALFGIVDDADGDRAKVVYLQGYISQLQQSGFIAKPD